MITSTTATTTTTTTTNNNNNNNNINNSNNDHNNKRAWPPPCRSTSASAAPPSCLLFVCFPLRPRLAYNLLWCGVTPLSGPIAALFFVVLFVIVYCDAVMLSWFGLCCVLFYL